MKMEKKPVIKVTVTELLEHFILNEFSLRQIFLKGRKAEINGGAFELKGISLKVNLPSRREYEMYESPEYGPLGNIIISVAYRIKTRKNWKAEEQVITDGIYGFDVKNEELRTFLSEAEVELFKLATVMYENWRRIKPLAKDYLSTQPEELTYKLFAVSMKNETHFIWARTYMELSKHIQNTECMVRRIEVGIDKDRVCEAVEEERNQIIMNGKFGETEKLKIKIGEEIEYLEKQNQLIQLLKAQ